jgi:hypothetical protein
VIAVRAAAHANPYEWRHPNLTVLHGKVLSPEEDWSATRWLDSRHT